MVNIDVLTANALQTKFNSEQIYHDTLPEHGNYPMVVYSDLTETPALHADNVLYAREHIIRVTLVTYGNHEINTYKKDIYDAMVNAGFMWQNTAKARDNNEYYTTQDFSIGNLEEV